MGRSGHIVVGGVGRVVVEDLRRIPDFRRGAADDVRWSGWSLVDAVLHKGDGDNHRTAIEEEKQKA